MAASLLPYISHFGEAFDAEKSSHYRMAIQFSLGGLSYALLDAETNTIVALECYQSNLLESSDDLFRCLEKALESKELSSKTFQNVTCLVDNRICTLIPRPLFNEADQAQLLEFSIPVPEDYSIISEPVAAAECVNVYALPKMLNDSIRSKWSGARITHTSTVFVDSFIKGETDTAAYIQVRNRDFDMLIIKNGKLNFFNNFRFNTKEDFAYFLLFALEQNGLSGIDTPVCFTGLIRPASEIIDLCGRYIKDLRFVETPHTLHADKALADVPYQYYFTLYQALR